MNPEDMPACPGCGEPAVLVIIGQQAMCGNEACCILMWDPRMTMDELLENLHVIDLRREQ